MFIRGKNSMLQPSDDNKHIHLSIDKADIQIFFNLKCKKRMRNLSNRMHIMQDPICWKIIEYI